MVFKAVFAFALTGRHYAMAQLYDIMFMMFGGSAINYSMPMATEAGDNLITG